MTQFVGRRLGRYEVQQEIGRGGMARVYRALDTLLQRPVAIKVMAPQLGLDPEFAHRFEREAIMAANLHHPAIITVYDVGDQDGLNYIAMEYIRGRTLHAILSERGALGLGYAVRLLEPVARALDYAHSQGAVHRDVKPHNIMVDVDGRVLLTDFGIAQLPESETTERLTRTGVFMGTPEYISPEQAQARRVDGRSDLYSLGIVGYEIITGRVPFSGATPNLLVAHTQTPPPPVTSIVANLPRDVDTVLARALAKNPQARFATGTSMVEALRLVARRNSIALPSSVQLAALASPIPASDGQVDDHKVQDKNVSPPVPLPPPRQPSPARSSLPLGADTLIAPPKAARPKPAQTPSPRTASDARSQTQRWLMIVASVLAVAVLLLVVFLFSRNANSSNEPPNGPSVALPTTSRQPSGSGLGVVATAIASATTEASIGPTPAPSSTLAPSAILPSAPPTVAAVVTITPAPSDTITTPPPEQSTITSTVRLTAVRLTATRRPSNTPMNVPTSTPVPPSSTPEVPTVAPEPPTAVPEPPTAIPEPPTEPPTAIPKPPTELPTELPTVKVNP